MGDDYARYFGEIALTHDLTTRPDERTWRLVPPPPEPEPHRFVLSLGCNVLRTSHMVRTITAIFDRLGLDYVAVGGPTYCCGIVHHREGDVPPAEGMSRHTLELFRRFEPEEVVMWCPSCIWFYDEGLHAEEPFPGRHATAFPRRRARPRGVGRDPPRRDRARPRGRRPAARHDLPRLPAAGLRLRGRGADRGRALPLGLRARPRHRVR